MASQNENFLNLKEANILIEDIVVSSGSTEQTNGKKTVNSCGIVNSYELDSAAKAKAYDLKLRKEISILKVNNYLCKNHIPNGLADDLYDYYSNYEIAKQVWEALQTKYDTKEAGTKKYVVNLYLKYYMV